MNREQRKKSKKGGQSLFLTRVMKIDIHFLSILGLVLAALVYVSFSFAGKSAGLPTFYSDIAWTSACLVASLPGFAQIARREAPFIYGHPYTGTAAIIYGCIWVAAFLTFAIIPLVV